VMPLSQLIASGGKTAKTNRPQLSDLRESGVDRNRRCRTSLDVRVPRRNTIKNAEKPGITRLDQMGGIWAKKRLERSGTVAAGVRDRASSVPNRNRLANCREPKPFEEASPVLGKPRETLAS